MCTLQHRGQDSCGMVTCDYGDSRFRVYKAQGRVYESLGSGELRNLAGNVGIGHVRYPTVGSSFYRDAQPFFVEDGINIGLAHNGNLANFRELKEKLRGKTRSSNDAEIILHLLTEAGRLRRAQQRFALATVVKINGSTYRRPGARMLIDPDGVTCGTISGGCLEQEVAQQDGYARRLAPRTSCRP